MFETVARNTPESTGFEIIRKTYGSFVSFSFRSIVRRFTLASVHTYTDAKNTFRKKLKIVLGLFYSSYFYLVFSV